MNVVHRILGFDKRTERLTFEFDVPDERLDELRELLDVPAAQCETYGSFALTPQAASKVAGRLQLAMNVDSCDWYFEPVAH